MDLFLSWTGFVISVIAVAAFIYSGCTFATMAVSIWRNAGQQSDRWYAAGLGVTTAVCAVGATFFLHIASVVVR
jgi:hypothetical protein